LTKIVKSYQVTLCGVAVEYNFEKQLKWGSFNFATEMSVYVSVNICMLMPLSCPVWAQGVVE